MSLQSPRWTESSRCWPVLHSLEYLQIKQNQECRWNKHKMIFFNDVKSLLLVFIVTQNCKCRDGGGERQKKRDSKTTGCARCVRFLSLWGPCLQTITVGSLCTNHFGGSVMYKSSCWGQCVQTMFVGSACTHHLWSRGRSVPCYKSWCFSWVWLADHPLKQSSQECVLQVSELVVQCPSQCHHHHRRKNLQMNLYNTKNVHF